ncbi:MAG: hypothetical protein Q4F69_06925 [Bacteroidia bacterium]|nr:hypothetical protein [Bacteroidia bacterium]
MKKTLLMISAVVLLLVLSQCRKPVFPDYGGGELKTVTFVTGDGGSKGEFVYDVTLEKLRYKWKNDDMMYVYASDNVSFGDGNGKYCGCLKIKSIDKDYTATFEGELLMPYSKGMVRFIHYGSEVTVDGGTGAASVSFEEQNGVSLSAISSNVIAMYETDYEKSGTYEGGVLTVQFAIANFSFTNFTGTDIMVNGLPANGLEVTAEGEIRSVKNGSVSILKNAVSSGKTAGGYYTVFIPETSDVTHCFYGDAEEARLKTKFLAGKLYHSASSEPFEISGTNIMPAGAVGGKFTVNADGTQVYFAKGNVQYQASPEKWRFAEHQYDVIGKSGNESIGSDYTGWIDLFGWATSGKKYNETFTHSQPYTSTSTTNDYKAYSSLSKNLNNEDGSADWGGNFGDGWFTPSKNQYVYIGFDVTSKAAAHRSVRFVDATSGNIHLDFRYSVVTIDGKDGVLLFPDVFQWTSDMGALPNKNSTNAKPYTVAQFELMEKAGAVFLPCAGYRSGTDYKSPTFADYWTSTRYSDANCYFFQFLDTQTTGRKVQINHDTSRSFGMAVRLVREAAGNSSSISAEDLVVKPW